MRYLAIPNTDLIPSVLCLGTGDLGGSIDRATGFAMLDAFFERGGSFLDTAKVYNDWIPGEASRSEKLIGDWVRERGLRDKVIIATKGAHPELSSMHIQRLSRADIAGDVEASLRHLKMDTIDLYYLHRDDPNRPVEEIIDALYEQAQAGKIRYYAASNWSAPRLKAAQDYAAQRGIPGFAAVQNLWNLANIDPRGIGDPTLVAMDDELWEYHRRTKLAAVPFSAQANGIFQKLAAGQPERISASQRKMMLNALTEQRFERLRALQAETGWSVTQIVLGYLMAQPFPTIPVIGPRGLAQLEDSLQAADIELTWEQAAALAG